MKNKILGICICTLLITTAIPAVESLKNNTINSNLAMMNRDNNPPVFGTPSPANNTLNTSLNFTWSIPITDPEGDLITWAIQCNNGQISTGYSEPNGTKSITLTNLAYLTSYVIWVNATDPMGSQVFVSAWYAFTTRAPSVPPIFGTPSPENGSLNTPNIFSWGISISDPDGDLFTWTIQCSNGQVASGNNANNGTKSLPLAGLLSATVYTVWVNATDPTGSGLYTRAWYTFTVQPNLPPSKPNKPSGNASGKVNKLYIYSTSTTDPNIDQVYYNWSWGDGNYSGWLGPFPSGAKVSANHTWTVKGSYEIKVKAKDPQGNESVWSDPLPVTMPQYNGITPYNMLLKFLEWLFDWFPHAFPILRHIVGY
ncbi:MAG TPA: hypothetical protein VMT57_08920 [Candidatus Thermoplasmatota archaeon]|nr:hypothetical protein [Candidatus Thermoplasmatota archaeon]